MMYRAFVFIFISISVLLLALGIHYLTDELDVSGQNLLVPPEPSIYINGVGIPFERGSYCWQENNQAVCADTAGAKELMRESAAFVVREGEFIWIDFDLQPSTIDTTLFTSNQEQMIDMKEGQIKLPSDPGIYIIELFVRWEHKGDAMYAFKIKIPSDEL
ncbi:hypothetical protein [Alkalihalobacillus sp. AL-G]|uniref:hypothetical protein n=1 Tax=Alkalihalobacillus sp. AL-G TaxID=2926399 RepID=UPI00272CF70F|nr:hypothetical protein [Alkalihalobacillus sp. AL-G]WLD93422.1 hypothetical protein MOJ78_00170 [Alkalihalobacillus sp. AL-G]